MLYTDPHSIRYHNTDTRIIALPIDRLWNWGVFTPLGCRGMSAEGDEPVGRARPGLFDAGDNTLVGLQSCRAILVSPSAGGTCRWIGNPGFFRGCHTRRDEHPTIYPKARTGPVRALL